MRKMTLFFSLATALVGSAALYGAEGLYENSSNSQRYFQPSYESKYKDRQIKQEINYFLGRHPGYRNTRLEFSVSGGVVYVQGMTDSDKTKAEITRDLSRIPGVKRVQNELTVDRNSSKVNSANSRSQNLR